MSSVINLLLSFSTSEDEDARIVEVNNFRYRGIETNLISVDFDKNNDTRTAWYGGTKFLEACLYIGAFNHFDLDGFVQHLKQMPWEEPENVQVIVKDQWDEKFRIIELI